MSVPVISYLGNINIYNQFMMMYIGFSDIALFNLYVFLVIQAGVQDGCQCMGRFAKLCKFFIFLQFYLVIHHFN